MRQAFVGDRHKPAAPTLTRFLKSLRGALAATARGLARLNCMMEILRMRFGIGTKADRMVNTRARAGAIRAGG